MFALLLIYGVVAGTVIIAAIIATLEAGIVSTWLGWLVMIIAFSVIFVAIRQRRDRLQGGVISFRQGLMTGLQITLVASVVYVLIWEGYLAATDHAFYDTYMESMLEEQRANGASEAELAAATAEFEGYRAMYGNPLLRIPVTFVEIFPVGLLISVISAFVLRKPRPNASGE